MVDERPSSRPLQHVVQEVLQLSEALAGGGHVGAGSGGSGQRGAQQPRAVRGVPALRGGRLAPLRLDGGESHELHPLVVARSRGHEHPDAAVVGGTPEHVLTFWKLDALDAPLRYLGPSHALVYLGFEPQLVIPPTPTPTTPGWRWLSGVICESSHRHEGQNAQWLACVALKRDPR